MAASLPWSVGNAQENAALCVPWPRCGMIAPRVGTRTPGGVGRRPWPGAWPRPWAWPIWIRGQVPATALARPRSPRPPEPHLRARLAGGFRLTARRASTLHLTGAGPWRRKIANRQVMLASDWRRCRRVREFPDGGPARRAGPRHWSPMAATWARWSPRGGGTRFPARAPYPRPAATASSSGHGPRGPGHASPSNPRPRPSGPQPAPCPPAAPRPTPGHRQPAPGHRRVFAAILPPGRA
jgi:hypothetical protein